MRQLTDGEMKTLEKGWLEHLRNRKPLGTDFDTWAGGFTAGLDHSAAQIAALTAENKRLREAQFKRAKALKRMVKAWRDEADGHYCQTYNTGQAKGLNVAANHLESYVKEAWREPET